MTTYDVDARARRRAHGPTGHRPGRNWAVTILGWVLVVFGLAILIGGVWLIALGGSWYYAIAGLLLTATGALLHLQRIEAVWIYLVTWVGTLAWAWWEVGADGWAQVPRLVAPTVVLILVLLCIPALRRRS